MSQPGQPNTPPRGGLTVLWVLASAGIFAAILKNLITIGGISTSRKEAAALGMWVLVFAIPMLLVCVAGVITGVRVLRGRPALVWCGDSATAIGLFVALMAAGTAYGGTIAIVRRRVVNEDSVIDGTPAIWIGVGMLVVALVMAALAIQLLRGRMRMPDGPKH
jgi:hypothetical protein